jgi:large subunit ribosomal protein L1
MSKRSRRYQTIVKLVDPTKVHSIEEAAALVKKTATAKFPETVELAIKLGIDPKQADQQVRGTVSLPNGTGKTVRVLVFATGEKIKEAQDAGATIVGAQDLVEKVNGGFTDFDVAISTPDMMREVGKLGKVLGPRGLMPNPKGGTVTFELAKAIKDFQGGKIEYRTDKNGLITVPVGKTTFEVKGIAQNLHTVIEAILRAKPPTAKGQYVKTASVSATMGPGIKLDLMKLHAITAAEA